MKGGRKRRGAAVIEFAVLLPLLLLILFGIIEFGFIWLQSHYIANAAREGARIAAKLSNLSDVNSKAQIQSGVKNYLQGLPLYGDIVDAGEVYKLTSPRVDIEVEEGTLASFGAASGLTPEPLAVKVHVTVQTHDVWEPIFCGWLPVNFPGCGISGSKIPMSESAVFVKE